MSEYVPTTEEELERILIALHPGASDWELCFAVDAILGELAAHDAEVAAKAWDEGHEVSCEDVDYICERFHPNPYRKAVHKARSSNKDGHVG